METNQNDSRLNSKSSRTNAEVKGGKRTFSDWLTPITLKDITAIVITFPNALEGAKSRYNVPAKHPHRSITEAVRDTNAAQGQNSLNFSVAGV